MSKHVVDTDIEVGPKELIVKISCEREMDLNRYLKALDAAKEQLINIFANAKIGD